MKKTITAITLLAGAVAGYSQGSVTFSTYITGTYTPKIFNGSTLDTGSTAVVTYGGYTVTEQIGQSAAGSTIPKEKPAGTTVYNGALLSGTGYDAELLVTDGTSATSVTQLSAASGGLILNFATGVGAGLTATPLVNEQVTAVNNGPVSFAIAAWNNEGGTVTSLLAAQQYEKANGGAVWGISPISTLAGTGGSGDTLVPTLGAGSNLSQSFALGYAAPEPSTIALGVMGASALLFRRRK